MTKSKKAIVKRKFRNKNVQVENRNGELSEGLLEAARMVQTKSGEGETSPVPEELPPEYYAAVEVDAIVNKNLVRDNVVNAEFVAVEQAADELAEANARNAEDDRVWNAEPADEAPKGRFSKLWFIGKQDDKPDEQQENVGIFQQAFRDMVGIGALMRQQAVSTFNKFNTWAIAERVKLDTAYAEFIERRQRAAEFKAQERAAMAPVSTIEFHEAMNFVDDKLLAITDDRKAEIKALNKRLEKLDEAVRKLTRSYNRGAPVKQEQLDALLEAAFSGKLISAVNQYKDITGCTLAEAKDKLQGMVAA